MGVGVHHQVTDNSSTATIVDKAVVWSSMPPRNALFVESDAAVMLASGAVPGVTDVGVVDVDDTVGMVDPDTVLTGSDEVKEMTAAVLVKGGSVAEKPLAESKVEEEVALIEGNGTSVPCSANRSLLSQLIASYFRD